jgi:SAM-dependent methyltransferase
MSFASPMSPYLLGHSDREIGRLMAQGRVLRPFTERLLTDAGIGPGMRVLDLGTGVGDVALIAAKEVGTTGEVIGIDRNPEVLDVARRRAAELSYSNVSFHAATETDYCDDRCFDIVIGRFVLLHQADAIEFLRGAASFVAPAGVLAIHEMVTVDGFPYSQPTIAEFDHVIDRASATLAAIAPSLGSGARLVELFERAGLPTPRLSCEVPTGNSLLLCQWATDALLTLRSHAERLGILADGEVDFNGLAERLHNQVVAAHAQVALPLQYCGWTRI